MLAFIVVPPLASASPACDLGARAFRDPHISFAFGGSADLRGRHNALYNFLSAPGISVNVKTEEAVFKIHDGALTVNGTFLTEAHVSAQLSPQKFATASFWASELDPNNFGWRVINGSCVGRPFRFGNRGHKSCFGFEAAMGQSSAAFELRNWTVKVHGMRSCSDRARTAWSRAQHTASTSDSMRAATHHLATARTASLVSRMPHQVPCGTAKKTVTLGRVTTRPAPRPRAQSMARRQTTRWRAPTRPNLPSRGSTQRGASQCPWAAMPTTWSTRRRSIASPTSPPKSSADAYRKLPARPLPCALTDLDPAAPAALVSAVVSHWRVRISDYQACKRRRRCHERRTAQQPAVQWCGGS